MSASPAVIDAVRALFVCDEEMLKLKHKAIYEHEITAVMALMEVAEKATRFVRDLWFEQQISDPFTSDPNETTSLSPGVKS